MGDKRTYKDRAQYIIKAVSKRRKKMKEMVVEYKGGKCQICGYDKCSRALNLHHIDGDEKEFGLSHKGLTRSWEKTKEEADKRMLVCANCHMEIHAGMIEV